MKRTFLRLSPVDQGLALNKSNAARHILGAFTVLQYDRQFFVSSCVWFSELAGGGELSRGPERNIMLSVMQMTTRMMLTDSSAGISL